MKGAQVQSLVRELWFHMSCGTAKKKKKKREKKNQPNNHRDVNEAIPECPATAQPA